MALDMNSVVTRTGQSTAANVDNDLVIVHFDTNAYYGFDTIGRRVWEIIETPHKVAEVCDVLRQEYDVSQEQCEADVLGFLEELEQNRILETRSN
jgi:hypothetical protein